MRVMACFMVIMVHSCEFFFIDGSEIGIRSMEDGFWVSVFDSAFRCSVPLFVIISAYLLVPVEGSATLFFKKRLARVVVPFAVWSLLYASLPYVWHAMSRQEVIDSLLRLAYNFNDASGHLWFVYMLTGLYLFMPVISPWLRQSGKKALQMFLLLWFLSSFFPYLRDAFGYVFGECYWNEYNMLWYFSGFIGYVVLAYYLRHHLHWSAKKRIAVGIVAYLTGYAVTGSIWYGRIPTAETLQQLELSWRFCTPNVILESLGAFLLIETIFRNAKSNRITEEISNLSYGMYLMHIFILGAIYSQLEGSLPTPAVIVLTGIITFLLCALLSKCLSLLPGSRYVIG